MNVRNLAAAAVTATLLSVASPSLASTSTEPYGGCKEAWQAPKSQGARDCRQMGYTVRPHFVIDPQHRLVATDLRRCTSPDHKRGCWRSRGVVFSYLGEVFPVAGWS